MVLILAVYAKRDLDSEGVGGWKRQLGVEGREFQVEEGGRDDK